MKYKNEYNYMCFFLIKVVELIFIMLFFNVWLERGVLKVKIIKIDFRNRFKNDLLNGLFYIVVNGLELCIEECDCLVINVVEKWIIDKKRRKFFISRILGKFFLVGLIKDNFEIQLYFEILCFNYDLNLLNVIVIGEDSMKIYMEVEVQIELEFFLLYGIEVGDEDEVDDVGLICGDDDYEKDRFLENILF